MATGQFQVGDQVSASASSRNVGFVLASRDKKQILQLQLESFTFSRLAPYQSWEPFRDEARRLWVVYRESLKVEQVKRLAVRYINRIDIPKPPIEIKDYLRTGPEISPQLPQKLAGYFLQMNIPQEDIKSTLLLNETIVPPPNPESVSIVLDIDLFSDLNVPTDEEEVWKFFEDLHVRKNQIFEACITDRTRELIE